jgi:hypothetical protein
MGIGPGAKASRTLRTVRLREVAVVSSSSRAVADTPYTRDRRFTIRGIGCARWSVVDRRR